MLKTISLTIYKVMKSYDGRDDIQVPNNYKSPPDIVDYLSFIQSIYYLSIILFCNKH